MNYRVEFPDYPASDMPTLPESFADVSWRNDAAPRFEGDGLSIYIDYADPAMREIPDSRRFTVALSDDDRTDLFESDSWAEVLTFIRPWTHGA